MKFTHDGVLAPILLVMLAAIAVYVNALAGDFVHDDANMIVSNPWIMDVSHIPDILFSNAWAFEERSSNFYRPVAFLLYMANYYLFGLDPWGFHLCNVLLHASVSILIFLVADLLFQGARSPSATTTEEALPRLLALLAALLFATHPIHTEPVAWISGISDLLFSLFFLASLYFHVSRKRSYGQRRLLSLLFFFLAALCKETALTLPMVFLAYDLLLSRDVSWTLQGLRKLAMRYMPVVLVAVLYLLLRSYVLGGFAPASKSQELTAYEYFINVFPIFFQYFGKLVLPIQLNVFYGFKPISTLLSLAGVIGMVSFLTYVAAFVWLCRVHRLAAFCLLWILIPLLPVLYLPALGGNPFSERYLYLPVAGFVMLLLIGLHQASDWLARRSGSSLPWLIVASLLIVALYSGLTILRNPVWASNVTLWADTARKSPDEFPVYINLASAHFEQQSYDEALQAVRKALHLNPRSSEAFYGLGSIYFEQDSMAEAVNALGMALRFDPRNPVKHYHLGVALARSGMAERAIGQFRQSIGLNSEYTLAYYQLGKLYAEKKLWKESITHYERAVQLDPAFSDAYLELGQAYEQLGELDKAARTYTQALRLDPDLAAAHRALGLMYEKAGDSSMALQAFKSAVERAPSASGFVDLGRSFLSNGMRMEAEKAFRSALALESEHETAMEMLRLLQQE